MTRRVYECSYCKERFSTPEGLNSHTQMHFNGTNQECASSSSIKNANDNNHVEQNENFREEFPFIYKRTVRICLERVEETDHSSKAEIQTTEMGKCNRTPVYGSRPKLSSKSRKGKLTRF